MKKTWGVFYCYHNSDMSLEERLQELENSNCVIFSVFYNGDEDTEVIVYYEFLEEED